MIFFFYCYYNMLDFGETVTENAPMCCVDTAHKTWDHVWVIKVEGFKHGDQLKNNTHTHTHTHSHKRALNMDNNEKKWHLRERSVSLECYCLRAFYSLKLTTTTAACNANIVRDGAPSSLVLRVAPFVSIVDPFFFVCVINPHSDPNSRDIAQSSAYSFFALAISVAICHLCEHLCKFQL